MGYQRVHKPVGSGFRKRECRRITEGVRVFFGFGSKWCNLYDADLTAMKNFLDKFSLLREALSRWCFKHAAS